MKYRFILLAGALCAVACQALFGNLSIPNGQYCNVGDDTCRAGQICDPMLHACVDANGGSDGGMGTDGGSNPLVIQDFFAAPVLQIPLSSGTNGIQSGVPYKANFDNMAPDDLFIMGTASYTIVTFTGPNTFIKTVNYKGTGVPEMAAIGQLDNDELDDVVVVFPADKRIEVIASKAVNPAAPTVTVVPRAIAIGDYDGDKLNDLAIADDVGSVMIYRGNGLGALTATPPAIDCTVGGLRPVSMVTVPGVSGSDADSLAVALFDFSASPIHRLELILGSPTKSWKADQLANLGGAPTDLVAGNFSGSSRDVVVLAGGNKLDVFTDLRLSQLSAKSTIELMPYRTTTLPPLRGRLAVGRFYPATVASKVRSDLAVLLDDGWVGLAEGQGSGALTALQVVNRRAVVADRLVAGDFILDSGGRDDLAAYGDRGAAATLTVVRNNVGGSLGDLVMALQHPLGTAAAASTPLVFTGRFNDAQKDDIVTAGEGPILRATRCSLDSRSAVDCSDTHTLAATPLAGAPITCGDQKARLLLALNNKALMLVDFTTLTAGDSQVIATADKLKQIEVADINKDGVIDIILLDDQNKINVIFGTTGGNGCTFATANPMDVTPSGLPASPATVMIAVGDANGDNYPDLLVGYDAKVTLYINSKDKRFSGGSLVSNNTGNLVGLAIADLRGPRKPEVVILSSIGGGSSSTLTVLTPDVAGGSFGPLIGTMALTQPYRRMTVADLGGDGLQELVLLNKARGQVTTASSFAKDSVTLKHYAISKGPEWLTVGQLDPDPASPRDIVVIDSTQLASNTTSLWILQGLLPGQLVP